MILLEPLFRLKFLLNNMFNELKFIFHQASFLGGAGRKENIVLVR